MSVSGDGFHMSVSECNYSEIRDTVISIKSIMEASNNIASVSMTDCDFYDMGHTLLEMDVSMTLFLDIASLV